MARRHSERIFQRFQHCGPSAQLFSLQSTAPKQCFLRIRKELSSSESLDVRFDGLWGPSPAGVRVRVRVAATPLPGCRRCRCAPVRLLRPALHAYSLEELPRQRLPIASQTSPRTPTRAPPSCAFQEHFSSLARLAPRKPRCCAFVSECAARAPRFPLPRRSPAVPSPAAAAPPHWSSASP